jgi:thiamine kinase-like enzyme
MSAAEKYEGLTEDVVSNITAILKCGSEDIKDWEKMTEGLTNANYKFLANGVFYVYRVPGEETDAFVDRRCELEAMEAASKAGVDKTFIAADPDKGWKISYFIEGIDYIRHGNVEDEAAMMRLLKKFHNTQTQGSHDVDFENAIKTYFDLMEKHGLGGDDYVRILEGQGVRGETFENIDRYSEEIYAMNRQLTEDGFGMVLCHNDVYWPNLLKAPNGDIAIIDWEYCGNNYPGCDVANYAVSEGLNLCEFMVLCEAYEGRSLNPLQYRYYLACLAMRGWYWTVWAIYQESMGTKVDELKIWYDVAMMALKAARPLF